MFSWSKNNFFSVVAVCFVLFCSTFSPVVVSAQGPPVREGGGGGPQGDPVGLITGKIIDGNTQTPMEYATVSLIRVKDTAVVGGMITDSTGLFKLEHVPYGRFRVKISFIGYKPYINDSIIIRPGRTEYPLGNIALESAEKVMETVEIEGTKSMVQIGPEKKVFNVDKMTVAQGGTAADILEQLPSITTDQDGNASMRGNGNVMILIDGKPSNLTGGGRSAVLDQIPANLIERIEVITNPSARYDPDGMSGIINIILKKNRKPGFYGSVNGNVGTNNKYNGGFNISVGNSVWNVSAGYTFRYTDNWIKGVSSRKNTFKDTSFYYDQTTNGNVINRSHLANFSVDFRPKEGHSFTVNGNFNQRGRPMWERTNYVFLDRERTVSALSERPFGWDRQGYGYESGFTYVRDFKKPGRKLNALINYSRNYDDIRMLANQKFMLADGSPDSVPIRQQTINFVHNSVFTAQLDYIRPLKNKQRYELGGKNITRTTDQDFLAQDFNYNIENWLKNANLSNRFVFTEAVYSAYGIYAGEYKKWEYQFGLRLEQAITNSEQKTSNLNYNYDYFSWFPSLHGAYKLSDMRQIQFNYSRRINRPDMEALNPFVTYTDPLNTQQGNPRLRPEYINSFELQYVQFTAKMTFTATLYYRYLNNQIIRYRYLEPTGVAVMTYKNLNDNQSYGGEMIVVNRWFKWWNTNASLNVFRIQLSDQQVVNNARVGGYAWVGKIISNFVLPKKIEIQASFNYRSATVIAQGEMKAMYGLDASIKIPVLKGNGNIIFNVTDIFNTRQFGILSEGNGFSQTFTRKRESRIAYLGFTYTFGNLKSQPKQPKKPRKSDGEDGGGGDMGM